MNNRKFYGKGIAILLITGLMVFVSFGINNSKPKCTMASCNEERTSDSQYCVLHDLSYKSYGNPDYNAVYKQSRENRIKNTSDSASDTNDINHGSFQSSYDTNNKRTYIGKSYDPYDVGEYDDPDDFAEEWAEEFGDGDYDEGYDDAYDYWEDEM